MQLKHALHNLHATNVQTAPPNEGVQSQKETVTAPWHLPVGK